MTPAPLDAAWFLQSTLDVARGLLGALLVRELPEGRLTGRIVETEAYLQDDPACHGVRERDGVCCHRRTKRNAAMFGPPGHAYVYFTYGNHFLMNVVTQAEGVPEAVLIRALEPLEGMELMARHRGLDHPRLLTNGPGKLAQALRIDGVLDGHDLRLPPLLLLPGDAIPSAHVTATPRIGISRAIDRPWRFYISGNEWVSRR